MCIVIKNNGLAQNWFFITQLAQHTDTYLQMIQSLYGVRSIYPVGLALAISLSVIPYILI